MIWKEMQEISAFFFLVSRFFLDPDKTRLAAWNLYKVSRNNHQISLQKNLFSFVNSVFSR